VEAAQKTPLWKIIGAVFLVLFAVGGFFAFRKRKA
jgi:LPXTG-motif cell wall-anchored protein